MNLAAVKLGGGTLTVDPDLDVIETTAIVLNSRKNGVIEVGGGAPKNFCLQTQPTLSQILGIAKGGHDYVIQITMDAPHYGGLSGATPSEAISWGKVKHGYVRNSVVVYANASIAAPLLFNYIMSTSRKKRLKRLYSKRSELVNILRAKYEEVKLKHKLRYADAKPRSRVEHVGSSTDV